VKIYAVRDRLIDYYMLPFVGHTDKEVMASIADTVNLEDGQHGIQQAPHHYEIWILAEVQEGGHITPAREFLADCGTLIRPRRQSAGSGEGPPLKTLAQRKGPPSGSGGDSRPEARMAPQNGAAAPSAAQAPGADAGGGYSGGNGQPGGYPFV